MAEKSLSEHWQNLSPKKKLNALLDHPKAGQVVRAFPAQELYRAIVELGLADSIEVVRLASPAQFRTFVDLGGWKKDQVDAHQVLAWLAAAHEGDRANFMEKVKALDLELLEVVLNELTVVHSLEQDPDVLPENPVIETPENKYLIELKAEGQELSVLRAIVNGFIAENPFEATRFFEAVRWELRSELEEHAYRFRQARLSDLGFPGLDQAASLYSYRDPDALSLPQPSAPKPQEGLARAERVDFFKIAGEGLAEDERRNLEQELRYLVNTALVAEGADPGDLDAIRRITEQCRDTLSLGIEHATHARPPLAVEVVRNYPLREIFQAGFSLTLRLKFLADRLAQRPLFQMDQEPLLLKEEAAAVAALRRKRPLRSLKVEGAEPVSFRTQKELADSELLLSRASAQLEIFGSLLGKSPEAARAGLAHFGVSLAELGTDRLWATWAAWTVLEQRPRLLPLPKERLVPLCQKLFESEPPPRIRPPVRGELIQALEQGMDAKVHPELERMVDLCLARFVSELGQPHFRGSPLERVASVVLAVEGQLGQ